MRKIILSIAALLTIVSCDIDLEPESSLIYKGYWQSEEALYANHSGLYSRFRTYANRIWALGELRSDIWGGRTMETSSSMDFIDINYAVDTAPYGNWGDFYGFMHNINDFIKNAENVNVSETEKKHMYGQVYGMRAYVYFMMMKTWGDIPLITTPLPPDFNPNDLKKSGVKRTSKEEVLAQIKRDIEKSLEYFGDDNSLWKGKTTYWSKNATLSLKGEVYLWSASVLQKGQDDYQTALTALQAIQGRELVRSYANLWGMSNENNNEFIFAFDYQVDQATNFYPGSFTGRNVDIRSSFDSKGNSMSSTEFNGSSRYGVSPKVMDILMKAEQNGDDRSEATFTYLFQDNAGYIAFNEEKYKASILKKFPGELVGSDILGIANVPVYRFADVVLMIAEAKNELHQDPSAEINQVRARAYGDAFNAVKYVNGSYEQNKEAILNERLKEFVGEGKRFWDLVRAGNNKLVEHKPEFANNLHKIYLPITRNMLADDQFMKQTEGYTE